MYSVIFFFVITTAVCDRLFPYKEVSVLREILVAKVNAIGRSAFNMDTAIITLIDGARHIVQTWSIDDRDPDSPTVEYVEVHAISSGYRVRVRYDLIEDVVEYSKEFESSGEGMSRVQFVQKMKAINAGTVDDRSRTLITLIDGARHMVPTKTIVCTGTERITYGEVHLMSRLYLMFVPYDLIEDVVEYYPIKLVSG